MMKGATERVSIGIRLMLLMICCVLLMPVRGQADERKEADSFRMSTLTLAISSRPLPIPTEHLCALRANARPAPLPVPTTTALLQLCLPYLPCPTSSSALRNTLKCMPVRRKVTGSSTGSLSLLLPR